jgi:ParB/RepB/Spo0J family partition protein
MGLDIRELVVESLSISDYNIRKDVGDLTGLISSITDVGVLEPILVRQKGEQYEVLAGSRRLQAARSAGHTTIPAIVHEITDLQAILVSLIENIHRKDLTLEERVETYQALQRLEPEYRNLHSLSRALSLNDQKLSHQKITQDFQTYEVLRKLQPRGFTLASHLPPSAAERQEGTALPQYHAVILHQAMSSLTEAGTVPEEDADEKLAELARLIAPMSQVEAKALIDALKAGEQPATRLSRQQGVQGFKAAGRKNSSPKKRENGGLVTCSCCNYILKLNCLHHEAGHTHSVTETPFIRQPQLPDPDFPIEPVEHGGTDCF